MTLIYYLFFFPLDMRRFNIYNSICYKCLEAMKSRVSIWEPLREPWQLGKGWLRLLNMDLELHTEYFLLKYKAMSGSPVTVIEYDCTR